MLYVSILRITKDIFAMKFTLMNIFAIIDLT